MSMDTNELARLRDVAEAATPGPWTEVEVYGLVSPTQIDGYAWPNERKEEQAAIKANRTFIAAFDPPTVLQLLAEIERLQAGREVEQEMLRTRRERTNE